MNKNTGIYILIVFLICIIGGCTTYIFINKNKTEIKENNKPNNENIDNKEEEKLKDSIKLVKKYENNKTYYQEYEIILNNNKSNMKITYNYDNKDIKGSYNNINFYDHDYTISDDNKNMATIIDKEFNANNFQIIKGKDNKSYLFVIYKENNETQAYIFNDKLELVTDESFKDIELFVLDDFNGEALVMATYWITVNVDGKEPWYADKFNLCDGLDEIGCHVNIKIDNNKIYYLVPIEDKEIVEERVYEINNSKMAYSVINTYPIAAILYNW